MTNTIAIYFPFQWMREGRLNFPEDRGLPLQQDTTTPFVIVADDAFPLGEHLQKPYALQGITYQERVFNYRLSRARRMSENVFGILASRFCIFLGTIHMLPTSAEKMILAGVVLHNFLRARNPRRYIPADSIDQDNTDGTIRRGEWRQEPHRMLDLAPCNIRNPTRYAKQVRRTYTDYFNGPGAVPWQDRVLEISRRKTQD